MYEKYIIVKSIDEAAALLSRYSKTAKLIAGGTDLVLEIERGGYKEVKTIIGLSRVPDIDNVYIDENKIVHIGPMVTHNGCLRSEVIQKNVRCLYEACEQVGSPQIRNRGTVSGNIATASPANDTISALMVLDTYLELTSSRGKRLVSITDFFVGPRRTVMQADELISDIQFKIPKKTERTTFLKDGLRNAQAISIVNTSVMLDVEEDLIKNARIALGAVGPTVFRAREAEKYLVGKKAEEDVFYQAGNLAAESSSPISDIRASDNYRRKMVAIHTKRALDKAVADDNVNTQPVLLWGTASAANLPITGETEVIDIKSTLEIIINGIKYQINGAFGKNLLDLLRENVLLTGTKEGCGEGECGACTVYMDGVAVLACLIPAPRAHNCSVTTIEGISEKDNLHKVQQTFIEEGAVQCGYCTPGFVMSAAKLLEENQKPSESDIETAISGNLCRCTGYYKIVKAIEKAAGR
jgi:xanthine dehydrogenase iron-sulfur cluster and FAD-binding subunit A